MCIPGVYRRSTLRAQCSRAVKDAEARVIGISGSRWCWCPRVRKGMWARAVTDLVHASSSQCTNQKPGTTSRTMQARRSKQIRMYGKGGPLMARVRNCSSQKVKADQDLWQKRPIEGQRHTPPDVKPDVNKPDVNKPAGLPRQEARSPEAPSAPMSLPARSR